MTLNNVCFKKSNSEGKTNIYNLFGLQVSSTHPVRQFGRSTRPVSKLVGHVDQFSQGHRDNSTNAYPESTSSEGAHFGCSSIDKTTRVTLIMVGMKENQQIRVRVDRNRTKVGVIWFASIRIVYPQSAVTLCVYCDTLTQGSIVLI
jgi:hypothetical protein